MQNLETLNSVLPLQWLKVTLQARNCHEPYPNGERLALTLPHLEFLELSALQRRDVFLTCPKLAEARFILADSLRIKIEDAALASAVFASCGRVELVDSTTEDHFLGIKSLEVGSSGKLCRHLIEDIGQMRHLEKLIYRDFSAASMPRSFPTSLQHIQLEPSGGFGGSFPEGLKELPDLKTFRSSSNEWPQQPTPSGELRKRLPIDRLLYLEWHGKAYIYKALAAPRFVHQGLLD